MAAPIGNQFWKLRSKHGRELLFATPELLEEAAHEYFEWCDKHPWKKSEFKEGRMRKIPTSRPYTLSGLCIYLGASEAYWKNFRSNINLSQDFLSVIQNIEETIRTQKYEGAAVGAFNASIIARDLGLADKSQIVDNNGDSVPLMVFKLPDNSRPLNTQKDGGNEATS